MIRRKYKPQCCNISTQILQAFVLEFRNIASIKSNNYLSNKSLWKLILVLKSILISSSNTPVSS